MTIIQPNNRAGRGWVVAFVVLAIAVGGAALILVVQYNKLVDVSHALTNGKETLKNIETENAELTDRTFNLLQGQSLDKLASDYSLVKDKNPHYLNIGKTWALASQ
ncbi:MAG TPA: hypothetical protein VMC43_01080 [Candidatus Paceibacterota bacterium]|nr:hypothetical protein [Candidatus Paceibacterota bacterium]